MIVHREDDQLTIATPAKVNLHLEVLGKRSDGYHELETLFLSVSLYDRLTFTEQSVGTTVHSNDRRVGDDAGNLVHRAVRLVRDESGCDRGVSIRLEKRIPIAAGLAGGSSDAAATLVALGRWWNLGWSEDRLGELAAKLGSDVAFFLATPAAIGRGRGEHLVPCSVGAPLHLVLICPDAPLATADVFRNVRPPEKPKSIEPMLQALRAGNVAEIGKLLHNRLEEASLDMCPPVRRIKELASGWNCLGHLMSGSGSTYFALCASSEEAHALGGALPPGLGSIFVVHSSS